MAIGRYYRAICKPKAKGLFDAGCVVCGIWAVGSLRCVVGCVVNGLLSSILRRQSIALSFHLKSDHLSFIRRSVRAGTGLGTARRSARAGAGLGIARRVRGVWVPRTKHMCDGIRYLSADHWHYGASPSPHSRPRAVPPTSTVPRARAIPELNVPVSLHLVFSPLSLYFLPIRSQRCYRVLYGFPNRRPRLLGLSSSPYRT
jgi:hypothetical protein